VRNWNKNLPKVRVSKSNRGTRQIKENISNVIDKFKEKYYFGNYIEVHGNNSRKSLAAEWEKQEHIFFL